MNNHIIANRDYYLWLSWNSTIMNWCERLKRPVSNVMRSLCFQMKRFVCYSNYVQLLGYGLKVPSKYVININNSDIFVSSFSTNHLVWTIPTHNKHGFYLWIIQTWPSEILVSIKKADYAFFTRDCSMKIINYLTFREAPEKFFRKPEVVLRLSKQNIYTTQE